MKIHFGLTFDDSYTSLSTQTEGGVYYVGPNGLLRLLESQLGIPVLPENREHLRIEWYRQALQHFLELYPDSFFQKSFQTDQFAVATALLERRDELLLAIPVHHLSSGLPRLSLSNFDIDTIPDRLRTIFEIEDFYLALSSPPGFAERFLMVAQALPKRSIAFNEIRLNEPLELLPFYWQRLISGFRQKGMRIVEADFASTNSSAEKSDLHALKHALSGETKTKITANGDGSVLALRFEREPDAATWFSKILKLNSGYQPVLLLPEKNRILDNAMSQEGLPCMGLLSASTARPSLQILRLITVFLWKPLDPNKVLEFVNLSLKPLDYRLSKVISELVSATPGTHSEKWHAHIAGFFTELSQSASEDPSIDINKIRQEYAFWFERKRYAQDAKVPVSEVFEIFEYLKKWAGKKWSDLQIAEKKKDDENNPKNNSLLSLKEQCDQILEMLEALPPTEPDLAPLELERLIRTIYKPTPVLYRQRQSGALDFIYQPASLLHAVDELVWWNFTETETPFFFSKWYPIELKWLQSHDIQVTTPAKENQLQLWQRIQPFLKTRNRIILVIPDLVDGNSANPHPLWSNLEGYFSEIEKLVFHPNTTEDQERLQKYLNLPDQVLLSPITLEKPGPFIELPEKYQISKREHETFSSIESLLYYPHQWVFKYFMRLKKSAILQVLDEHTLYGNLSHRIFELLLQEDFQRWDRSTLNEWIDRRGQRIIENEGAILMLYGMEPERVNFLNKVKAAAWSLISTLKQNSWAVDKTEMELEGHFGEIPVFAKADLVLKKGAEFAVIDLKWRGERYRSSLIKNEEDIQLVMYSRLVPPLETWMHTAYFIISNGRLILRNNAAFADIPAIRADASHAEVNDRIWHKMLRTWDWRNGQLAERKIEIRTEYHLQALEEAYEDQLWDFLEMKKDSSAYDDYKVLLGMVD